MKKYYFLLLVMLLTPFSSYSHHADSDEFLWFFAAPAHSYSWCTWLSDCWNGTARNVRQELESDTFNGNHTRFANALQECISRRNYTCFSEIVAACKSKEIPFEKDVVIEKLEQMKQQRADEVLLLARSLDLVLNPVTPLIRPISSDQFLLRHSERFGRLCANKKACVNVARLTEHDLGEESDEESYEVGINIALKIKNHCADSDSKQKVDDFFGKPEEESKKTQ